MMVWALDIATTTGFAWGEAGGMPQSCSVRIRRPGQDVEIAPFNIMAFLRDRATVLGVPDLVFAEAWMNPAAQKSADAVTLQILTFGAVAGIVQTWGVPFHKAAVSTIRTHFCGQAHANERAETKRMVIRRCQQLRYLPFGVNDDNRADALAAWSFAECAFGRRTPSDFTLFGQEAAAS